MGFFVSYRNAALYYVMMPNIWWIGFCTFAGGAGAVAVGLILKQLVIISSHSTLPWDRPLYKSKLLRPIVLFLERIIITPAFHHGHHGRSKLDGVSDPNGNFGNMFSIWDQLFGSANFSHDFPIEYGLQTPTDDHWTASYLYPAVASSDESSELARSFNKSSTVVARPERVEMEADEKVLWCACGMSRKQPYCDGSHHGSKVKPMLFEAPKSGRVKLCNCKLTKSPPYCDGAHKTMDSYVHPVD
jgi:CDGSH-type Zn-finger protein